MPRLARGKKEKRGGDERAEHQADREPGERHAGAGQRHEQHARGGEAEHGHRGHGGGPAVPRASRKHRHERQPGRQHEHQTGEQREAPARGGDRELEQRERRADERERAPAAKAPGAQRPVSRRSGLYRQKAQVKLLQICLASLAACAVLAAQAHAQTGNGLYEPFPSPSSEALAQDFVDALPGGVGFTDLNGLDLRRGVLVGRADAGSGFAGTIGWPLALALLAAVLAGAGVLAVRRA